MRTLKKIAVIAEAFPVPGPAQQVLDRLLAGYPHDGAWAGRAAPTITLYAPGAEGPAGNRRQQEHQLEIARELASAVQHADGVVVFGPGAGETTPGALLDEALSQLGAGAACFVHGLLGGTRAQAAARRDLALRRKVALTAAGELAVTPRLPEVQWKRGSVVSQALIVVQGPDALATWEGVEGLWPDLERGGVRLSDVVSVRPLLGEAVWRAGDDGLWSWDLLASALSRSSNPQGDSLKDGRTQDLVGLGVVRTLATSPRAWITEFAGGGKATILALDGVVADVNLAMENRRGVRLSTRLYRPPAPAQHAFSRLTAVIADFFVAAEPAWGMDRAEAAAGWCERLRVASRV